MAAITWHMLPSFGIQLLPFDLVSVFCVSAFFTICFKMGFLNVYFFGITKFSTKNDSFCQILEKSKLKILAFYSMFLFPYLLISMSEQGFSMITHQRFLPTCEKKYNYLQDMTRD